tara:strand:+ start:2633 stop:3070 length:438 start_codon:yes stop_codon:yes gene_type:complete
MNSYNDISSNTIRSFFKPHRINRFQNSLIFLSGFILFSIQQVNSEEIFLKCSGQFEINRGELIRPDWETSFIRINLDGLKSIVNEKGIVKEGRTKFRRNSFTITSRDRWNSINAKYKINRKLNIYQVDYPQSNRKLIGTCQKGRG